jgi:hypothetical protein
MDNARVGDGIVRHGFRTREDGTLETRDCEKCGRLLYVVPTGAWLHWGSLLEQCSDGQEGEVS